MTFDGQILGIVVREFDEKRLKYETEATARQSEIYEKIPRIAEIDGELRSTIFNIINPPFLPATMQSR